MNSTRRKIPPSEWERHKDIIVELYRKNSSKVVQARMLADHDFNASPWQYERQFKRWGVRKNANRNEWHHYFSTKKDLSIPNSLDLPGDNFPPVILNKTIESKKRARRWISDCIVAPDAAPASQASGPIPPSNENAPVLSLNGPETQLSFRDSLQNMADAFRFAESFQLLNEPNPTDNFTAHNLLESPSQVLADVLSTPARSLGSNLTSPVVPTLQSPFYGLDYPDLPAFSLTGLPSRHNMAISILQGIRDELPFAQLEQSIQSSRIMLDRSAGHTILGGFASRVVAGILGDQSTVRQTTDWQRSLRMLGAQIPGENSALITDDQAFETEFARVLLFSTLNGFACLDDIPMEKILRFLNRVLVNELLLDVLEKSPQYVSRTLADNIFRAAIEATDTKVVKLLLERRLVDVNETVCFHNAKKYTPIERASSLRSLNLMRSLIDAGADVNKSHADSLVGQKGGALNALILNLRPRAFVHGNGQGSTIRPKSIESLKMLLSAGARVSPIILIHGRGSLTMGSKFLLCRKALSQNCRNFGQRIGLFCTVFTELDAVHATKLFQTSISTRHQVGWNKYLVKFGDTLGTVVVQAASAGNLELVQLLLRDLGVKPDLPKVFLAAIGSNNPALIEFILGHGPDLDPPARPVLGSGRLRTPIAEAVSHGNEYLIQKIEERGCFDHITEGGRFAAVVTAAAEAGNVAYMRMLLARAGTSKQAYRVTSKDLGSALIRGHQDIAYMLLEAGAISTGCFKANNRHISTEPILADVQMVRALIASGMEIYDLESHPLRPACFDPSPSIATVVANEYPGCKNLPLGHDLSALLRNLIETNASELFEGVFQTLDPAIRSLDGCLAVAVELEHSGLIEYLLDMGANPFQNTVLQAAIPDKPDMLRLLIQKERRRKTMPKCIGARVLEPLMGNGFGNSEALDELIRSGTINFVRLEILYNRAEHIGFRKGYYDSIAFTPLGMAIQGIPGRFDSNMVAMRKFLDAKADPNGIAKSNENWTKGSPLMTALMVAIETGLEDAVNMLLDYGAEVNGRPRIRTTRTALQFAAELGNMDMVRLLLSRGADANSSASSRGGATALQFAAMAGNCNMVAELLDHGAQLDALPSRIDGMWPLEGAAANGRLDMIRFLWELKGREEAKWEFPKGFSERQCLRAMNFARENGRIGCRDLISELSRISVDRLETDDYGAPWIAY